MAAEKKPIIECDHVDKIFETVSDTNEVVRDFNLKVYENEFVVLFGPGQCGKTTLLNLVAGLEKATNGKIIVSGEEVEGPSPKRGMVYQKTSLFPWFTVMQNVEFGLKMKGIKKAERRKKAQYYIDLVGLNGFENHFPVKFSGGMQQRAGIARAYCNDPEIICMDEPFGHLDAQTRYVMEEEVERICSSEKRTVLFVTNNIEEAIYLADRIILLCNCPTTAVKEYKIDLPRPRDIVSPEFLALRDEITKEMDMTM